MDSFLFHRGFYKLYYERSDIKMLLLTMLVIITILLTIFAIIMVGVTGGFVIIVFGDLIVCVLIIAFIIKKILNKKKN